MRVLVAGASGAIGMPITRQLLSGGHGVLALTRSASAARTLADMGAQPVVADALDRDALLRALDGLTADAIINQLTALKKPPRTHHGMLLTDRLRIEGTANLLAAAERLDAPRFVTQSIIFGYGFRDLGDRIVDESTPFGAPAGDDCDPHVAAMLSTEQQAFTSPEGIALRYGLLYGGDAVAQAAALAKRQIPVARGGLLGWVHHDDAARATVAALERGAPGQAYNIVDDRPATWAEVFTEMAADSGTKPPRHLPRWMFRLAAPYVARFAIDTSMRVDNTKARRELDWSPEYPTYHDGLRAAFGAVRA